MTLRKIYNWKAVRSVLFGCLAASCLALLIGTTPAHFLFGAMIGGMLSPIIFAWIDRRSA